MEKFAGRTKKIAKFGLLVFVSILFSQKNFAQNSRRAEKVASSENYFFEADEEFFFVNQDSLFKLFVPEAESSDVRIVLPTFPENIIFVSSRSENFSSPNSGRGTQIELNLSFKDEGIFSLPPISLFVNGKKKIAAFSEIKVLQNPQTVLPRAILVFESGETFSSDDFSFPNLSLVQGAAFRFTLCVQYAAALGQVSWTLPKDSIFKELRRFEIPSDLKSSMQFSKKIPVAQFEWTPLAKGNASLPKIKIAAESYSGQKLLLETPDCVVKIIPQKRGAKKSVLEDSFSNAEKIFEDAFVSESGEENEGFENAAPEFDALSKIARLRSQERHSLFQNKIRVERAAAEISAGMENTPNEESFPFFILIVSAAAFFAALSLSMIFLRKKKFAFAFFAFALFLAIFAFALSSKISARHGIVVGGEIYPVPENSVVSKAAAVVASRVLVRQEIDNWYFIEYNESGGWIKKENLILIK